MNRAIQVNMNLGMLNTKTLEVRVTSGQKPSIIYIVLQTSVGLF